MDPNSNMPCWYFEKKELKNTPSTQDGIDYETECRYRKEGARFIIDTGTKMDLGYNTMATGVVYFHRFYMYHSFRNFPRYVTACCCLFLAGKVEETPKKCKDIIKTAKSLLTEQKFATFGEDPREEVMTLERILLQTIKFDLQVEHPYSFLLKYAKSLKGDKAKLHKMVQMAWTFVNDSLCTTLSLQWEPEVIAVALMYLAGKLSKFEVVDWVGRTSKHLRWWDMFVEDITMDLLEDICHQVLDLYSQSNPQPQDSPPMVRHTPAPLATPTQTLTYPAHNSPAGPPPVISTKPNKSEGKVSSNGEKIPTVTGGVVSDGKVGAGDLYGYSGYTSEPSKKPKKSKHQMKRNPTVTGGVVSDSKFGAGELYGHSGYTQPPPSERSKKPKKSKDKMKSNREKTPTKTGVVSYRRVGAGDLYGYSRYYSVLSTKPNKSEGKMNSKGEKIPTVTGGVVSDGKVGAGDLYRYLGYSSGDFPPAFTTTRLPLAQFPPSYSSTAPPPYPPNYYPPTNHSQSRPPY